MQVTTLGQPLEVLKTQMAANRSQTMFQAMQTVWSRGGVAGFYQGLIPWVRILLFCLVSQLTPWPGMDRGVDEGRCSPLHCF